MERLSECYLRESKSRRELRANSTACPPHGSDEALAGGGVLGSVFSRVCHCDSPNRETMERGFFLPADVRSDFSFFAYRSSRLCCNAFGPTAGGGELLASRGGCGGRHDEPQTAKTCRIVAPFAGL